MFGQAWGVNHLWALFENRRMTAAFAHRVSVFCDTVVYAHRPRAHFTLGMKFRGGTNRGTRIMLASLAATRSDAGCGSCSANTMTPRQTFAARGSSHRSTAVCIRVSASNSVLISGGVDSEHLPPPMFVPRRLACNCAHIRGWGLTKVCVKKFVCFLRFLSRTSRTWSTFWTWRTW